MSQNHHTPWVPGSAHFRSSEMNAPLSELDEAITNLQFFQLGPVWLADQKPPSNAEIIIPVTFAFAIPADLLNSLIKWETNNTGEVIVSLTKNGVEFGTITVSATQVITLSAANYTTFDLNDTIGFVMPTQDTTWAGVAIQLKCAKLI